MFKDGMFVHKDGITIVVVNGTPFLKGDKLPLTVRTQDIFNIDNWREVKNEANA